jgi:hypothetical protein
MELFGVGVALLKAPVDEAILLLLHLQFKLDLKAIG